MPFLAETLDDFVDLSSIDLIWLEPAKLLKETKHGVYLRYAPRAIWCEPCEYPTPAYSGAIVRQKKSSP